MTSRSAIREHIRGRYFLAIIMLANLVAAALFAHWAGLAHRAEMFDPFRFCALFGLMMIFGYNTTICLRVLLFEAPK